MTDELAIKIEHVSKEYRLGAIGGGTLKGDLQSWWARKRGKEDPNSLVTSAAHRNSDLKIGDRFLALDDISFEVKKGEALGIIGHNGAGKSTLLKLLSRVTAPTTGKISYNGRITSMLEVGTGFHPELTGRENIYMNGAILGLTKTEIDQKIEEIIDFSEVRQFIDTPVKRYSSGMYVKLAFSVASHLDSEIMIMDEVLAVGDMAFQKKCLSKMRETADREGRTVLYVSHNMNTIRQLCDRCIVMDHGHIIFNGGVEDAIAVYMGFDRQRFTNQIVVNENLRDPQWANPRVSIEEISLDNPDGFINTGGQLNCSFHIRNSLRDSVNVLLRVLIKTPAGIPVSMTATSEQIAIPGLSEKWSSYTMNLSTLAPGTYSLSFVLYEVGEYGADRNIDVLRDICPITVIATKSFNHGMSWNQQWWGYVAIGDMKPID